MFIIPLRQALKAGADINVKADNGDTALTLAISNNNNKVARLLQARGAK